MTQKLQPVLLGADLNAYHVARAFYEAYGVVSEVFGRYAIGATQNVRILHFTAVCDLDTDSVTVQTLLAYAEKNQGKTLVLMGCTDDYVALIIRNRQALEGKYIIPYISYELLDEITRKDKFYGICEKVGLPYPKTVVCHKGEKPEIPFAYPVIIKPSYSVSYWKYPFDGMKKVYTAKNQAEAYAIIDAIYASGYPDTLIIQDRIPGDDSHMYTLTAYVDQNHNVSMMCLGHVLLEEHTPRGLGNHCAIVTECNRALMDQIKSFLESIPYTGFANFDIKFDPRDNSYRVFEINVRQGRSNYYVTATGRNIARLLVDDRIEQKPFRACDYVEDEIYWRYIPDSVVFRYTPDALCQKIRALKKAKKAYSSFGYRPDTKGNPRRVLFEKVHTFRHRKKFKTYYHPERI